MRVRHVRHRKDRNIHLDYSVGPSLAERMNSITFVYVSAPEKQSMKVRSILSKALDAYFGYKAYFPAAANNLAHAYLVIADTARFVSREKHENPSDTLQKMHYDVVQILFDRKFDHER